MRKIVLFACFILLIISSRISYGASLLNSTLFSPPLTDKEISAYKKIGDNDKEIQKFIETRLFIRKVAAFVAELPKGVTYDPEKYGGPQPTPNVNTDYTFTFPEYMTVFRAFVVCGGGSVTGQAEGFPVTGDQKCGLNHPEQFDCGTPLDRNSVLSQLTPLANPEEITLFEMANKCPAMEIPRFLATRKYMRQIYKLKEEAGGKEFELGKAPPMSDLINKDYLLKEDDPFLLMNIQFWQINHP